ncbi:PcfJ domain-containing protein [Bradyrhizobium yuanmingense]|uniref:PcfJ domain-containing protein n=1 Tax=Bradyrhizobium yuanmingense TaxID=108015 RepID=UPI0023BA1F8C|nr:PcfJ domain-containing protein [Bradyrhizobium yuanmingense]MDF0518472.1 PcfJ domain-containing protein [Bradyrhizobium yuanmingense]
MAQSLIQRRREAERARVEAYELSLRHVSQRTRPPPDFKNAIKEARRGFEADIVRDAEAWQPRMKTRDAARLRLAAARYLFARYPVAEHLEQIWIGGAGLDADEIRLRKRWYIAAAGGGSLYAAGAAEWLSRKEVHAFLNPLGKVGFEAAIWQAIARSYATDPAVAMRIARTRITQTQRAQHRFWREVRFFCAHPTTVEDMDDFHDYLAHCHRRDPEYSLKGRSLISLGRQMREWHRDLDAIARIEAARRRADAARNRARGLAAGPEQSEDRWLGAAIADWSWTKSSKDPAKREEYVVVQLRTAADLVVETRSMRHCVASYASKCIAGHASIWSLRRRAAGAPDRLLTIELDRRARAVQVRGFANRAPHPEECKILERWAQARGIELL